MLTDLPFVFGHANFRCFEWLSEMSNGFQRCANDNWTYKAIRKHSEMTKRNLPIDVGLLQGMLKCVLPVQKRVTTNTICTLC